MAVMVNKHVYILHNNRVGIYLHQIANHYKSWIKSCMMWSRCYFCTANRSLEVKDVATSQDSIKYVGKIWQRFTKIQQSKTGWATLWKQKCDGGCLHCERKAGICQPTTCTFNLQCLGIQPIRKRPVGPTSIPIILSDSILRQQWYQKMAVSIVTRLAANACLLILTLIFHHSNANNIAAAASTADAPNRRFEYKYSFKGPHLSQADGNIPFWVHSGSKFQFMTGAGG